MKVRGKVVEKHGGEYSFMTCKMKPGQNEIPIDAKVTVEWNADLHECEENSGGVITIERRSGGWYVVELRHSHIVGPVPLCPFCGEKLT